MYTLLYIFLSLTTAHAIIIEVTPTIGNYTIINVESPANLRWSCNGTNYGPITSNAVFAVSCFSNTSTVKNITLTFDSAITVTPLGSFSKFIFENDNLYTTRFMFTSVRDSAVSGIFPINVTNADYMFYSSNVSTDNLVYQQMSKLESFSFTYSSYTGSMVNIGGVRFPRLFSTYAMFSGARTSIVGVNNMASVLVNCAYMFLNAYSYTPVYLSGWDVSNVLFFTRTFWAFNNLRCDSLNHWNTSNARSMYGMFYSVSCAGQSVDFNVWNTGLVSDMISMFYGSQISTNLDLWCTWSLTNFTVPSDFAIGSWLGRLPVNGRCPVYSGLQYCTTYDSNYSTPSTPLSTINPTITGYYRVIKDSNNNTCNVVSSKFRQISLYESLTETRGYAVVNGTISNKESSWLSRQCQSRCDFYNGNVGYLYLSKSKATNSSVFCNSTISNVEIEYCCADGYCRTEYKNLPIQRSTSSVPFNQDTYWYSSSWFIAVAVIGGLTVFIAVILIIRYVNHKSIKPVMYA